MGMKIHPPAINRQVRYFPCAVALINSNRITKGIRIDPLGPININLYIHPLHVEMFHWPAYCKYLPASGAEAKVLSLWSDSNEAHLSVFIILVSSIGITVVISTLIPFSFWSPHLSSSLRFNVIRDETVVRRKTSKSPFSTQIKAATTDSGPVAHVSGPHGVKTPSLQGWSGWQQQHMVPQWLRSISSCNGFVGASGAVDLQNDINSWNENRRLIGYGCIVDSGAVNSWRVARVSDSERAPRAEDHHYTPLIDSNCNPSSTVTVFNCQRRQV